MSKLVPFFLIVFFMFFSSVVYGEGEVANKGIVDVKGLNETQISLKGEWEFYWSQLLSPEELKGNIDHSSYIQVPGSWQNQTINGTKLTRDGYGTYRLKLSIPREDIGKQKALSIYYVGSAYRLWIEGREYNGLGTVGTSADEEILKLQKNLVFFEPREEVIDIVMQVSNYSFREGGIISEIVYGDTNIMIPSFIKQTFYSLFLIGGFFIIGIYHVLIFVVRKNELAILFIGLTALAFSLRTLLMTEYVIGILFPKVNWEMVIRVEYLSEMSAFLFLVLLVNNLYPKEVHRLMVRLSFIVASVLIFIILLTPSNVFTSLLVYQMSVIVVIGLYFIFYIGAKVIKQEREEAKLHLIGLLILLLALVNDVLFSIMVINTFYMVEFAFIVFILIQAIIVSNRYALVFKQNKTLTEELLDLNHTLEEKIEERTRLLHQKNYELIESQQMRTKLLANIAHDIGTPLVGMKTYLQLVRDGKIHLDVQKNIPILLERLGYVSQLNYDLFELSKLEGREDTFQFKLVTVKHLMDKVYEIYQPELAMQHMTLDVKKQETTIDEKEVLVEIDIQRIFQVFQNYIDNAVKFSRKATNKIELNCYITSSAEGEHNQEIRMEVVDYGEGIEKSAINQVFTRLYKKREGNDKGSGLGLAIAKEIIERHQGRVGVSSEIGHGSTFYFTLPIVKEQSEESDY